jgi:hypothetical protein
MNPGVLHALNTLYSVESPKLGFGFCLDYSIQNSFAVIDL